MRMRRSLRSMMATTRIIWQCLCSRALENSEQLPGALDEWRAGVLSSSSRTTRTCLLRIVGRFFHAATSYAFFGLALSPVAAQAKMITSGAAWAFVRRSLFGAQGLVISPPQIEISSTGPRINSGVRPGFRTDAKFALPFAVSSFDGDEFASHFREQGALLVTYDP